MEQNPLFEKRRASVDMGFKDSTISPRFVMIIAASVMFLFIILAVSVSMTAGKENMQDDYAPLSEKAKKYISMSKLEQLYGF